MDNDVNGNSSIFQKASRAVLGAIDSLAGFALKGMGKDPKGFDKEGARLVLAMVASSIIIIAMAVGSLIAYAPSQGGQKGSAPEKRQETPAPKKSAGTSLSREGTGTIGNADSAKIIMAFGIRPIARTPHAKGITQGRKNANVV